MSVRFSQLKAGMTFSELTRRPGLDIAMQVAIIAVDDGGATVKVCPNDAHIYRVTAKSWDDSVDSRVLTGGA